LGNGKYAEVFKAEDLKDHKEVAIKIITLSNFKGNEYLIK
jgi:hypothetical protein